MICKCGTRMIKNGVRRLKYRGVVQNFCAGVVESRKLLQVSRK